MWDKCKTCGRFIPPSGASYTGDACMYRGYHPAPTLPQPMQTDELTKAINRLAKAVENLATQSKEKE